MKKGIFLALIFALNASVAYAQSDVMVKGVIKKIDSEASKIAIDHEAIPNLDMPAMTMVFRVSKPTMIAKLKTGDRIKFHAEIENGQMTVTKVEK